MTAIHRSIRPLALTLLFFCVRSTAVPAVDNSSKIPAIVDATFRPLLAKYDVPGMAVAIVADAQTYFFTYGVASREKNTPVTKATLFEIGSVSKVFTATLVSYAQVLGEISLDDHPGKYLTQLQHCALDQATLLNLGTYTAGGLPLQFPETVTNAAEMESYFRQWKPSAGPGAERRYSNPSIGLVGYIASRAMKGDFADLLENKLFPQLGLRHSYIRVPEAKIDHYAWGYDRNNQPIRVNPGVFDAEAYGVKSTAADMIGFIEANLWPGKFETQLQRAIEGTHVPYFQVGEMVQGLGWERYSYPVSLDRLLAGNSSKMIMEGTPAKKLASSQAPSGPTLFNKTGSTNGFSAYIAFVTEKKIGLVLLANKNFPIPARITAAHTVLEQLSALEQR